MMLEIGTCPGIENYSLYTSRRQPGERPACLLDYFPDDFLMVVDESHVSIPQINGMYNGDRSRKLTLIEHGFRLPSRAGQPAAQVRGVGGACVPQAIFVSATPGDWELRAGRRRGGRADHPPDRARGSGGRRAAGEGAGGRPAGRDPRAGEAGRAGPGDHAHQAHGRGPVRVPAVGGRARALHALRGRHHRAHGHPPLAAAGQDRRAGGHQPPARGARPARGVAGGDPRRRQGGLPARRPLPDPDHRPGRAERGRDGRSCTPTGSPRSMRRCIDETDRRREIQIAYNQRARHHARDHPQEHRGDRVQHPGGRRPASCRPRSPRPPTPTPTRSTARST